MSLYFLALDCFPRYMEAPQSREFVYALQQREVNGEQLPIRTVSVGLVRSAKMHWFLTELLQSSTPRFQLQAGELFRQALSPVALPRGTPKIPEKSRKLFLFFMLSRAIGYHPGVGWGYG